MFECAIDSLDDDIRAPVKLYLQGFGYKQIASMLETDVRTVKRYKDGKEKITGK